EHYWRPGLPKADKLIYRVFVDRNIGILNLQSGEIDILNAIPARNVDALRKDQSVRLVIEPSLGYQGIWLNVTKPPFDNLFLRKALEAATDRDVLIRAALNGLAVPSYGPFPPASPVNDGGSPPERDLARAREYLKRAGYPNGFSFTLSITPDPAGQLVAQVLQNMWAEAGIRAQIEQVEWGQLLDKMDKLTYQATPVGWSGRAEPDQNIYAFFYTNGGFNNSGYSNPTVDQLLDQSRLAGNLADRKRIYHDVLTVLRDELPYIYLYHPNVVIALRRDVQGFTYIPDGLIRLAPVTK
ncbi:MAG: ABC transporter substrate-binding protein, partial [Bacillota bacterium]